MPYRIDLFSVVIFLGLVQAIFLSFFFLWNRQSNNGSNLFRGIMLLSLMACGAEIFLMYTGYIQRCLYLVDFSEPFTFLIGPSFYIGVKCMTTGKINKKQYVHYLFPLVYLLLLIPFLVAAEDFKYNSWVHAYQPGLPFKITGDEDPRWFWLTEIHTELSLLSLGLYGLLGLWEVRLAFRQKSEKFWSTLNPMLIDLRWSLLQITSAVLFLVAVKTFYQKDTGDHLFAAFISFTIYSTSFRVIQQSNFFSRASLTDKKYKSSTLSWDQQKEIMNHLALLMQQKKPYLQPSFLLPELSAMLKVSVHQLSQTVNEQTGKSFSDLLAEYRIAEAKILLKSQPNIKIEEIAEQVGYHSKSSFNTSFKRITGQTPSDWRSTL